LESDEPQPQKMPFLFPPGTAKPYTYWDDAGRAGCFHTARRLLFMWQWWLVSKVPNINLWPSRSPVSMAPNMIWPLRTGRPSVSAL
jgi:hypothetical protein